MFPTLLISFVSIALNAADESELKQRVLDEYPKAILRLEAAFSAVHGTMTHIDETATGTPEQTLRSWQIEFSCDGTNRKYSRRRLEDVKLYERVLARNRLYQFKLTRQTADAPLLVEDYVAQVANTDEFDDKWGIFVAAGINAPFSIDGYSLVADVRTAVLKVDRVTEVERDGHVMFKISFHVARDETDKLFPYHDRWMIVSPSEAWVIHEYHSSFGRSAPGRPLSGRIEYEGRHGDIPIPRRVVSVEAVPYLDSIPYKHSFDISELQFQKTPDKDFTLTFFGLPEMGRPTKQGLNLFGYGFVAVGCVLIALAAAIKYRAARR